MNAPVPMTIWRQRWSRMSAREQRWVLAALLLVGLTLAWLVLVQPAWNTLERTRKQRQVLEQQEQTLLQWQATARALQSRPALARQDVMLTLQTAVTRLGGNVTLQLQGDVARLTLARVPAAALAAWMAGVNREGTEPRAASTGGTSVRLVPVEVRLSRSGPASAPMWEGTLLYRLPAEANETKGAAP